MHDSNKGLLQRSLNNSILSPAEFTKASGQVKRSGLPTKKGLGSANTSKGDLSVEGSRNYNWLTGAPMTLANTQKLNQITQKMGLAGRTVLVHDLPRRQLLVNTSVLQRNQQFKEKVTTATQVKEDTAAISSPSTCLNRKPTLQR